VRNVGSWLDEYGESHRNPTNKLLHFICVPAIVLAIFGLLWAIPLPTPSPWINVATLVAALVLLYYAVLSPALAGGMLLTFVVLALAVRALAALPWPLWATSTAIFVIAWAGQFVGHALEGKRPSFFKDVQFLLIGPLWLLAALYRRLGYAGL
jgi:uncharacterized membrane protein YGL010W